MAWGEKYNALLRDRFNVLGTVKIYRPDYSGDVTTLIGAGSTPLKYEFCSESDNVMDPFKSSRVVLTVWSYTMFALAELYSFEDMYHKVEIFHGENLYWTGYIDPHQCTEQYGPVPYPVKIYCIDGLTLLKNILYEESPGTPYNGRIRESQIILDILAKIGFTSFYEFCNIYEDRMPDSVDDSPFDQTYPDVDIFKDMSCYEVLEKILNSFNAIIRQSDGAFYITRPTEMIEDSVAGRYFTGATTKNSVTIVPDQFIYRPDTHPSSTIRQVDGGPVMHQSPAKKVTIKQNYGNKESWIDNWELKGNTYNDLTGTWKNWTNEGAGLNCITDILPEESDGCVLPGATTPRAYNIFQEFGQYLIETDDILGFSFDYLTYNFSGGALTIEMFVKVAAVDNSWFLNNYTAEYVAWTNSLNWVDFYEEFPVGSSGWKTYSRKLEGLPTKGPYIVILYGGNHSTNPAFFTCFKNVKLFSTSGKISILRVKQTLKSVFGIYFKRKYVWMPQPTLVGAEEIVERQYTKTNPINGNELEYHGLLGDVVNTDIENVLEQFAGALAVAPGSTLSAIANVFKTAKASTYYAGGVILTSNGVYIIFNAEVAGVDFTGNTSITNTSGDLAGNVYNTQANVEGQAQIDTITITPASGGSGTANITFKGLTREITWTTSRALSIQNFITDHEAAYNTIGVLLDNTTSTIIATAAVAGVPMGDSSIVNTSGTIDGTVENTQENIAGVGRIDTIELTGTEGSADILCDGVTEEIAFDDELVHSESWRTRTGSESKELLQIICDEKAEQYSRPKQLIQMPIMDMAGPMAINLLGNIQDTINTLDGKVRAFVINRGEFDERNRMWNLDLFEIGTKTIVPEEEPGEPGETITADSTIITADSTIITADDG